MLKFQAARKLFFLISAGLVYLPSRVLMATGRRLPGWSFRGGVAGRRAVQIAVGLVIASGVLVATGPVRLPVAEAVTQPPLLPAAGQFVSVQPAYVLDTLTGLGESSAQPLAAGATITFSVTGADEVPSGAQSVAADIFAYQPSGNGFLSTYDPDLADPGVASVGLTSGSSAEQTDTVAVSVGGMIAITNHSTGSVDLKVAISGYFTGRSASSAADTYTGVPWAKIVDTSTGLGTSQAPIPAGGTITVQVTGKGGIATGADSAFLQVNAFNATTNSYLNVYPAGSPDPGVSSLRYHPGDTYRNLVYTPLSSSGQITIANHGTAPVDVTVYTRGYFMSPSTTPVGAEYAPLNNVMVYGTASAGQQIPANSSVTFQVAGTAGLPASGISEVAQDMVVTSPAATGTLTIDGDGTSGTAQAVVSFLAGAGTDVGYDNSIVSQISPSGEETVTNTSSGSLYLQVSVVGYFFVLQPPPTPTYVQTTGTDTTTPILSAVVKDDSGDSPIGEIFLLDSAGNPIGGSPTAVGQVPDGERVTWRVPDGTLSNGSTYQWYMEACDRGVCSSPTATKTFTVNTGAAPPPPTPNASANISGNSITAEDAITDPGACSGSDCPVVSNATLKAGGDGTNHWASGLLFNLSAIPANAIVTSATLDLTQQACLGSCGSGAWPGTLDIYPADSSVTAATTGPQLAAAAHPYAASSGPGNAGSYDVTLLVQAWVAGESANDGLVLEAAGNATAASGGSYYSPTASAPAADLPQLTVEYVTPTPPGDPGNLNVTPGDGGAEVSWHAPTNQGDANGVTTYTSQALTSSGTVAATASTAGTSAVLTGLTNGQAYTISVTATNAEGTSPATTATGVTPAAVAGSSNDIQAVQQFLNSQTALQEGQYSTAPLAVNAMTTDSTQAAMISDQLNNEQLFDTSFTPLFNASDVAETSGTDALSSTLVVPISGGGAYVYATDNLTYTTLTAAGTSSQDSTSSGALTDYLFRISGGTSPAITGYVDANAATYQVTESSDVTASATTLNDNPDTPLPPGYTTPAPTAPASGSETVATTGVNRYGAANWAVDHWDKGNNGFHNDCTDFVSRALSRGGDDPESPAPIDYLADDQYWWYSRVDRPAPVWTYSWSVAYHLAVHNNLIGSYWVLYWNNGHKGDIIFADWSSNKFSGISHAGMITKMSNGTPLITEHTNDRLNESLQRWLNYGSDTHVWIAVARIG